MLEKEKFPQDYFPEVGAGPGRQAAAERPEQALRPGGVASPWLFPGTGGPAHGLRPGPRGYEVAGGL